MATNKDILWYVKRADWLCRKWVKLFASMVNIKTTLFAKNLNETHDDVQKLAEAVDQLQLGEMNIQSDWNQSDVNADDYIKGKPTIPSTGSQIALDTTNFNHNLSALIDNVQKLAEEIDNHEFLEAETDPAFTAWLNAWDYKANEVILDNSNWGSGNLNPQCVTVQDLANEVDALTLGAVQLQGDWNQTDINSPDFIKNKPTIPAAQIQSDWSQSNVNSLDYIKNKPTIPAAGLVNIETLTANRTMLSTDKKYQLLNPGDNNRIVNLPNTGFSEGAEFVIMCNSTVRKLTIQFGGVAQGDLLFKNIARFVYTGTNWESSDHHRAGQYSIALGWGSQSYSNGLAIGNGANGSYDGVALGNGANGQSYSVAVGPLASTNGQGKAIALGHYSKCERYNELAISADNQMVGKKYRNQTSWFGTTTDATQTELFLGGSSGRRFTILASSAVQFKIDVVGVKSDGTQAAAYKIEGLIRRDNANNTVFVGTPTVTVIGEDDASWDAIAEADNTNEALVVKVTGASTTTVNWHAAAYYTEVRS